MFSNSLSSRRRRTNMTTRRRGVHSRYARDMNVAKSKQKAIYEIPHDDSKGDVVPLTPTQVDGLKNNNEMPLDQVIEIASILTNITKLPIELVPDILKCAVLSYAAFSIKTDELLFGRNNMNHGYLSLSIPSLNVLDFPPGISLSKKCSQLIVECSSHDQGWSSHNHQYSLTYHDSYTWSEVAILKKKENVEEEIFEEVDRTKISANIRADQSFRHHMKRFYKEDGFVKNVELGDKVTIFLRSAYPGWKNTANFASITVKFPIVVDALVMR